MKLTKPLGVFGEVVIFAEWDYEGERWDELWAGLTRYLGYIARVKCPRRNGTARLERQRFASEDLDLNEGSRSIVERKAIDIDLWGSMFTHVDGGVWSSAMLPMHRRF